MGSQAERAPRTGDVDVVPVVPSAETAYLVVLSGPELGTRVAVEPGGELVIGRQRGVGLHLSDTSVSRHHASLSWRDGQVVVRDLDSRNGTFVDGRPIEIETLTDGARIQVGVATILKLTFVDAVEDRYQRRLIEAALSDPLTGVHNRRYLDERLAAEVSGARRYEHALSVMMIDLDDFKAINDYHGHVAGDCVLQSVAHTLARGLRAEDVLARYGGEEFVVLLRATPLSLAEVVAERLRHSVEHSRYPFEAHELAVSISVGVAELADGDTPVSLLERADAGAYRAKRGGRNRVVAVRRR